MIKKNRLILTCEHAVNHVPEEFKYYFEQQQGLLNSHRGLDFGALEIANHLKNQCSAPLINSSVTRLLIDCNRSLSNSRCYSEISLHLLDDEKKQLIDNYYHPYRQQVELAVAEILTQGHNVFHISIHSFTPALNGLIRNADIGLLYDPKKPHEKQAAMAWRGFIRQENQALRIRMNYPYRGTSDGLTTFLRKNFNTENYYGIELECNQAMTQNNKHLNNLFNHLTRSLNKLLLQTF